MFSAFLIRVLAFVAFVFMLYVGMCMYDMVKDLIKRRKDPDLPVLKSPMERMKALARTQKRIEQAEEENEFEPRYYSELQRVEWHDFSEIDKIAKT